MEASCADSGAPGGHSLAQLSLASVSGCHCPAVGSGCCRFGAWDAIFAPSPRLIGTCPHMASYVLEAACADSGAPGGHSLAQLSLTSVSGCHCPAVGSGCCRFGVWDAIFAPSARLMLGTCPHMASYVLEAACADSGAPGGHSVAQLSLASVSGCHCPAVGSGCCRFGAWAAIFAPSPRLIGTCPHMASSVLEAACADSGAPGGHSLAQLSLASVSGCHCPAVGSGCCRFGAWDAIFAPSPRLIGTCPHMASSVLEAACADSGAPGGHSLAQLSLASVSGCHCPAVGSGCCRFGAWDAIFAPSPRLMLGTCPHMASSVLEAACAESGAPGGHSLTQLSLASVSGCHCPAVGSGCCRFEAWDAIFAPSPRLMLGTCPHMASSVLEAACADSGAPGGHS